MVPEGIEIFRFPPSGLFSSQLRSARSQLLGQALKGEGDAQRRVRGEENGARSLHPSPGPLVRATLSLQERDCPTPHFLPRHSTSPIRIE